MPGRSQALSEALERRTIALQTATQWDSLAHIFNDCKMYNDRDCTLVSTTGAARNSIAVLADRVVSRGVLADVARHLGVKHLALNHWITVAELEGALEQQRVDVRSGDLRLIRTGNLERARAAGAWDRFTYSDEPGIGLDLLLWIHDHEAAAIVVDTWALEVLPSGTSLWLPVHAVAIVHMGLPIGEIFDLEAVASDCEKDAIYEFFFSAPPLPLTGAMGSPINPLAIK